MQKTPEQAPKAKATLGPPWRVILNAVLIFFISQVIALASVSLIFSFVNSPKSLDLTESISGQFIYILIAELLAALLAIKLVRVRRLGLEIIGLGRRPKPRDVLYAGGGFLIFFVILIITGVILNIVSPELTKQQQNIGFKNIDSGAENLLAFISLVLLPPLGEEILVRGYLFSGLRRVWRLWPAILTASFIFGIAHLEAGGGKPLVWAAAINTFLLSVVLCWLRERTGALYASMLVHMANNLVAFGVYFR